MDSKGSFLNKIKDMTPYFIMALFILIVQVGSLWLSETEYIASQPTPDNPESIGYTIYYIVVLLVFSALLVYLIKKNKTFVIRGVIYLSIGVTLYYVFAALFDKAVGLSDMTNILVILAAALFTILIYKYPEWYVIDLAGLTIAIGACAVIGVSISYVPIILLMIGLLIYDFISVYKTKHMLTLANGIMDLKLPIVFVIPKSWRYSYIDEDFSDDFSDQKEDLTQQIETKTEAKVEAETETKAETETGIETKTQSHSKTESVAASILADGEKAAAEIQMKKKRSDALFMGLGDAVIPTLLVVSANTFIVHDGRFSMPSLMAMAGTFVGFAVLMYVVSKGKPQAGLPFLNTGAILGFAVGVLISGAAVSFNFGF